MKLKFKVLTAGALFFLGGQAVVAQQKRDSVTTKEIEEVVVLGYQTKKSEKVTSSVVQISGEELEKLVPTTTAANMLQGRMAGVDITALSGKPGSGANINIRGLGNLTTTEAASSPLIVLDGNILGNDRTAQFLFNSIPATDIESVSTLKDAAAAAIYGSQGANGVLIVTTRGGKSGQPVISYSSRLGTSEKIEDINFSMMNTLEKIEYDKKMRALGVPNYTRTWTDQNLVNQALANDHNWQNDILRASFIQSHNFGIRAGNEKNRYSASLTYDSDNGIIQNIDALKRISSRFKFDGKTTDRYNFGFAFGATYRKTQEQRDRNNTQNPIRAMYDYLPYEPVFNADGTYNPTSAGFAILNALLREPDFRQNAIIDLLVYNEYKILPSLTYKLQAAGVYDVFQRDNRTLRGSELDRILGVQASAKSFENTLNYTITNTLNFKKSFGAHNLDLLGLVEGRENIFNFVSAEGRTFSSLVNSEINNTSTPFSARGFSQKFRTFGVGAFATYDFADKYIFTASVRKDADSRFGANNVWSQPFWSVSGAWNITKENFLLDNEYLNTLKIRASYGLRGYNNIPLNQNLVNVAGGTSGFDPALPTLIPNASYGNADLKWEVTKSSNIGLEFAAFNRRFSGTVDYFIDKKEDFILQIPNAGDSGGGYSTFINAGAMTNRGFEISANYDILRNASGFNWSVRANISFLKYRLDKLLDNEKQRIVGGINMIKEGEEPFVFFLNRSAGINPSTGREVFLDVNGNRTESFLDSDRVALTGKSPLPEGFGGFGTTFSYKGFDAGADFTFKYGNYIYNYMARNMLNYTSGVNSNMRKDATDVWTASNPNASLPAPVPTANGLTGLQVSDRFLQDGSYIRLRNLTLGYTFNKLALGNNVPFSRLRLSLTGQNLLTWTKFEGDPEVSIGSGESQLGAGQTFISGAFALYSYPQVKTYMFGIDLEF